MPSQDGRGHSDSRFLLGRACWSPASAPAGSALTHFLVLPPIKAGGRVFTADLGHDSGISWVELANVDTDVPDKGLVVVLRAEQLQLRADKASRL